MKRMLPFILCAALLAACTPKDTKSSSTADTQPSTAETMSVTEIVSKETLSPTESTEWQAAYAEYLENFWKNEEPHTGFSYSLIYLDTNDIPELFIHTSSEASGEIVLTYHNKQVIDQQLSRIGTTYIERSGLIYTNTGHMGYYPVTIRKLENGEFTKVAEGNKVQIPSEFTENGEPVLSYEWEGVSVSEKEFNSHIDEIYDRETSTRPERWYTDVEMMSILKTGKCTSTGHRYELIQADVSWSEAQTLCTEAGGYLATITSPDEQDTIAAQIKEEQMQDVSFFVGYRSFEKVGEDMVSDRWINSDGNFTYSGSLYGFWKYSAPDYDTKKQEWDSSKIDCKCGLIKYYNSINQIFLFDAPDHILQFSPEYNGKLGYICEFD